MVQSSAVLVKRDADMPTSVRVASDWGSPVANKLQRVGQVDPNGLISRIERGALPRPATKNPEYTSRMEKVSQPRPTNLGVAQMAERALWEREVAGSKPVTQTNSNSSNSTTSNWRY